METFFASAERTPRSKLISQSEILGSDAVIDGLLETVGGLLAVLNKDRQIISLNNSFLEVLGIDDPGETLGLRPGEALKCVHSCGEPAGCGTTEFCSTCGAAIAMVSSLKTNKPAENVCVLKLDKEGRDVDMVLKIKAHPIIVQEATYLLIFLQDITLDQQRAALERTFFHDINNMLSGLIGASEILAGELVDSPMVKIIRRSSLRLQKAVEIQKFLLESNSDTYNLVSQEVTLGQIREDLINLFEKHHAKQNKTLEISSELADFVLVTDISLLQRVLANMITNALEASTDGETVRVTFNLDPESFSFCVHNNQVIPEDISRRIFQRNFSTKGSLGRGIGTFSMKMFGEKILGGKVSFISTPEKGTVFTFSLPV